MSAEPARRAPARRIDGRERISVALDIDEAALRKRVLEMLHEPQGSLAVAASPEGADVLVADHLLRSARAADLPVLLIGERSMIEDGVRQGYSGGLPASCHNEQLRVAIEAAALGLLCMQTGGEVTGSDFDDESDAETRLPALTLREAEVLQLLMTGASNKEIARELKISAHTAKFHVASIIGKLGATGRTDAVARALRLARAMI